MSTLEVYLVTFNCGRTLAKPEAFASHFFDGVPDTVLSSSQPPDLIVLHLQEIAPIAKAFNGHTLPQYYERFKTAVQLAVDLRFPHAAALGRNSFVEYTRGNAGLTAIVVFARADVQHRIGDVMSADVGVGVQRMGNKGAVGVRFAWQLTGSSTSNSTTDTAKMYLTFVSAHLAPMEDALERRNQDYVDIVAGLVFEPKGDRNRESGRNTPSSAEEEPLLSSSQSESSSGPGMVGMYEPDSHIFFAGDLNYRTSLTRPAQEGTDVASFPQPTSDRDDLRHWSHLLPRDQLRAQMRTDKTLHGLTESEITFPPTYKYSDAACGDKDVMLDSEVNEWKWSTHRWPSWCDRILYSQPQSQDSNSNNNNTQVLVHRYTSLPLLSTSDHRPVALSASIPLRPVHDPSFAARRPVPLDSNWRANRDAARLKESVVGTVWGGLGAVRSVDGALNLTMGVAAVVCIAVVATVYAREW